MKYALTLIAALLFAPIAQADGFGTSCEMVKCEGAECGCALKKGGWKEIARCDDGHQWSYVLEQKGKRRFCDGINARGGPSENACIDFAGSLEKYKKQAAAAAKKDSPTGGCIDGFGSATTTSEPEGVR